MKNRIIVLVVGMVLLLFSSLLAQAPDTLWTKTFGGPFEDVGWSVQQTNDQGYIISGWTFSYGIGVPNYSNVLLIKTDANGVNQWIRTYGGSNHDVGYQVQQTTDKGYITTGWTDSFGGGTIELYLVKTDSLGDTLWTKVYHGENGAEGYSVKQTIDKGYIITGYTMKFGPNGMDVYLVRADSLGDTLWTKTFGGNGLDIGSAAEITIDGGYVIVGSTWSYGPSSDVYLIKTDSLGNQQWVQTIGGINYDGGYTVDTTLDGGYIITGETESFGNGSSDVYLIKIDTDPSSINEEKYHDKGNPELICQPNLFSTSITISYSLKKACNVIVCIYSISGILIKTLQSGKKEAGIYSLRWNGTDNNDRKVSAGIYFTRLTVEEFESVKKIVLVK
jgi:hypothetical protein